MGTVVLQGGNVIDVATGSIRTADVVVGDGMIEAIQDVPHASENAYVGAQVINVSGKWLMPGLIDMHVHIKEGFAPQFVASGVTTVRNTGGNVIELRRLRESALDAPTPHVISADRLIDGPPGCWGPTSPWNLNTDDPEVARREVRRQVGEGADFIKVYGLLNPRVMEAVVEEARTYHREVSCDLLQSSQVTALDAARMGVKWNEHASGFLQAMYPGWTLGAPDDEWQQIDWDAPDRQLVRELCEQVIEHGVILCPTMDIFDQIMRLPEYWEPNNLVIEETRRNTGLIGQWEAISGYTDALRVQGRLRQFNQVIAKTYFDLGGTVVAGTDVPAGIWTFPGMALHREMELFVEAGFSTLDAIKAATITAAEALGLHDRGQIVPRTIADLVVLNANPLTDITKTQDIEFVVKGGCLYTQAEVLSYVPSIDQSDELAAEFLHEMRQHLDDI